MGLITFVVIAAAIIAVVIYAVKQYQKESNKEKTAERVNKEMIKRQAVVEEARLVTKYKEEHPDEDISGDNKKVNEFINP